MTEPISKAELEQAYSSITARWVAELRDALPLIEAWWEELAAELAGRDPRLRNIHWPAGPVSHPRFIAIYRKYFFEILQLNQRAMEAENGNDRVGEEVWGTEAEEADLSDEGLDPIPPDELLLERLPRHAPDLGEYFRFFAFRPIGEDDDLNPC
jgi:hypothetical protein